MNKLTLDLAFSKIIIEEQNKIIKELKQELEAAEAYGEFQLALRKGAKLDARDIKPLFQASRDVE